MNDYFDLTDPILKKSIRQAREASGEIYDPCSDSFMKKASPFLDAIPSLISSLKRICPYCRTDPVKMHCVNCGAPQTVPEAPKLKEGVYYGNY